MEQEQKMSNPRREMLIDPAKLRAEQIAREHKERFEMIIKKLLAVMSEEKVTVVELPVIMSMMTGQINTKFDTAEIEQIFNLNNKA